LQLIQHARKRVIEAEATARRKEEKKNQKSALGTSGRSGGDAGSGGEDSNNVEGEEGHFDSVATLSGPTKSSSKSREGGISAPAASGTSASASTAGANIDGAPPPPLLNPDLPHLAAVLDKADVVIEVLDARDPLAYRSSALEARVASKGGQQQQKLLLVLNKIGACALPPLGTDALHVRVIADGTT